MIKPVLIVIALHAIFITLAYLLPPDTLGGILRSALLIACLLGILRWGIGAWSAFKSAGKKSSMGILGVVALLVGISAISIYSVVFINMGRPEWLTQWYLSPYFVAVQLVGVSLLVFSTTFEGEKPTSLSGYAAFIIATLGVLLTNAGAHVIPWLVSKGGALMQMVARLVGIAT